MQGMQCRSGQTTEPASLVPLMRNCEAAVLVGDPCQLPPTVLSSEVNVSAHLHPLLSLIFNNI